ncbi:MAG TPA: branched-chain amino acid ABC transporter permease [Acidimicrobiia bacterium]|nr:branched-chain amino acid ABC transporter permease [Acidimicrobiia bacterium]
MDLFLSQLLNGIGNGVVYASLALALVLIFRTTGFLNFAQGEMALFSTYVTWQLTDWGLPVVASILISMALAFIMGVVIERVVIRPVEGGSPLVAVIVTLGLFLAFNSISQLIFGTESKVLPSAFPDSSWDVGGIRITAQTVGLMVVLAAECLLLYWLLQRTKLGLAFRAVSSNAESSKLVGISVGSMLALGWGLSAALGALAGAMVVPTTPALTAASLQAVLVYSFAGAALGGFDSPLGAVVGGITIGVAQALTIQYIDPLNDIELVVPFALIGLVLLFRPSGLFGRHVVERV